MNDRPLLLQQQRLLRYELTGRGRGSQNTAVAFLLEGRLSLDLLDQALARLLARHQALRLCFRRTEDGTIVHHELEDLPLWQDHAPDEGEQTDGSVQTALLAAERLSRQPMELFEEPAFSFHRYVIGPEQVLLLVKGTHVLLDGPSLSAMYAELAETYEALLRGEEPEQTPVLAWGDFVIKSLDDMDSDEGAAGIAHWEALTAGHPSVTLAEVEQSTGRLIDVDVGVEPAATATTAATADPATLADCTKPVKGLEEVVAPPRHCLELAPLQELARKGRTSVFQLILYAYTKAWASILGRDGLCVTYTLTDRFQPETRYMVGLTTHNVPFRLIGLSTKEPRQLLMEGMAQAGPAFRHFAVAEAVDASPFCLSYLSATVQMDRWKSLTVRRYPFEQMPTFGDATFILMCAERDEKLVLYPQADPGIYLPTVTRQLFARIEEALQELALSLPNVDKRSR